MPDPTWQALYRAALVESDSVKLSGRIEAARRSIRQRMEQTENSGDARERQKLNEALGFLFTLAARKRSAELVFSARVFREQLRLSNLTAWLNNANQA